MDKPVIAPCEIAFRPLDLDHPRSGIRQTRRRQQRCNRLFQRHDEHP
jgi:hypothetical protein